MSTCTLLELTLQCTPLNMSINHNYCCFVFLLPSQLAPAKQVQSCESQSVCFSPSPMYSPTESFLQITDISSTSPILVRHYEYIHTRMHTCRNAKGLSMPFGVWFYQKPLYGVKQCPLAFGSIKSPSMVSSVRCQVPTVPTLRTGGGEVGRTVDVCIM